MQFGPNPKIQKKFLNQNPKLNSIIAFVTVFCWKNQSIALFDSVRLQPPTFHQVCVCTSKVRFFVLFLVSFLDFVKESVYSAFSTSNIIALPLHFSITQLLRCLLHNQVLTHFYLGNLLHMDYNTTKGR